VSRGTDVAGRVGGAERVESAIRTAASGGRPALAAFLTAGFPSLDGFADVARRVAAEADVLEIGVPFSDPMADGVTIQDASRAALAGGVTLGWILEMVGDLDVGIPIVLMSYLNPILSLGYSTLAERAADAGVAGFIVPDLPLEECEPFREGTSRHGLALVQMVTPLTPTPRRARLAAATSGFLYAVTRTGTTGTETDDGVPVDYLAELRDVSERPVLAGFGIRRREQVDALTGKVDGVIVGSALVECLAEGRDPAAFLRGLRTAAHATTLASGGDS
jgi:tryptophan synthase alpha chain